MTRKFYGLYMASVCFAANTGTSTGGAEQPKNPVPDAPSLKPVAASAVSVKDPDAGDPPALSKDEEKSLEALLGDGDESTDPDRPAVAQGHVASAAQKLQQLVARIPKDTPNEHLVWGAAGVSLNVGDLRELAKYLA